MLLVSLIIELAHSSPVTRFMSPATIELPFSLEPVKVMCTSLASRITTGNSSRPG
jgi:hypothetical protein